jgi:hypothetical protein
VPGASASGKGLQEMGVGSGAAANPTTGRPKLTGDALS